jgi:2'-deoxynucleoside 5'-phosphate N-hydrolase
MWTTPRDLLGALRGEISKKVFSVSLWLRLKRNRTLKIFLSIKFHPDHSNREVTEEILQILEHCGAKATCIVRDFEKWGVVQYDAQELMRITLREIRSSHLVVVDLTEKGVGVGIEAGYAVARGIPVFTIANRGCEVSTTLAGISEDVFTYAHPAELSGYFERVLGQQIH